MIYLGIESSCDETACALVDDHFQILANTVYSQIDIHAVYGGVVPEIAARAHLDKILPVYYETLKAAGLSQDQIGGIAFTRGPGLLGPLLVGSSFARGLALKLRRSIEGINHIEGHVASAFLTEPNLKAPFVALVVSGGHTELWRVDAPLCYTLLGKTRDDAAGEAFDKSGKLLGLGYPAGPQVSKEAETGDANAIEFPQALDQRDNFEFSFSGLKTSVLRYTQSLNEKELLHQRASICASLQKAIVESLVKKACRALRATDLDTLLLVGGVSANPSLRLNLQESAKRFGFRLIVPSLDLCGDNAAMIAAAAQMRRQLGLLRGPGELSPNIDLSCENSKG